MLDWANNSYNTSLTRALPAQRRVHVVTAHIISSCYKQVFGRHDVPDLQRVELPAPIVAERIRIIVVPSSWTRSRACMRVEAHGCPVHTSKSIDVSL